jgi:16S rRNA (adenine1518-N6/adenine1519-N6)-dimethyltransferase
MDRIHPLKRFGQNYLIDKNIINKIIDEFKPSKDDLVLEIGPGTGALTSLLADRAGVLYGVELDIRVIEDLREKFPMMTLINSDFMKIDLSKLVPKGKKIRIIGNIPYNITSPIIFKLIENRSLIRDARLMVQYEVAKRITAEVGSRDYSILSVLSNYFAETDLCFKISPNVFRPKPKVFSAVISMVFNKPAAEGISDTDFIKVVKASFGNRRKTLKNSLSNNQFGDIDLNSVAFDLTRRGEELTIGQLADLTRILISLRKKSRSI